MKHSLLSYLNHISSLTNDGTDSHPAYLIFVRNAVSEFFLAECKKIPEKKQENYCFGQICRKFTHFPSVKFTGLKMCECKKKDKYQVCTAAAEL